MVDRAGADRMFREDAVEFVFNQPYLVLNIDVNTAFEDEVSVEYALFNGPPFSETVRKYV